MKMHIMKSLSSLYISLIIFIT